MDTIGCHCATRLVWRSWFWDAVLQDTHLQILRLTPYWTCIRSQLSFDRWLSLYIRRLNATCMCISNFLGPILSHTLVLELIKHLIIGSIGSNLLIFLGIRPHDLFCIYFLLHHLLVSQSVIVLLCDGFIVEFTLRYLVMNLIELVSHRDSIHTAHNWLSS